MADWKQVINQADIRTARLIIQLQMQNAAELTTLSTNTQLESDAQLARKIFEDELKTLQADFPGRALGEKITVDDNDREASFEAAAFGWKFDEYTNDVKRAQVPAAAPAPAPAAPPVRLTKCVACTDQYPPGDIIKAQCPHHYCRNCLESLFRSSMKDETLYPPRCCKKPIPVTDASRILPRELAREFVNRKEEFETKDKTYCHRPQCSTFIRPYTINGNLARCPGCREATCVECKNKWHFGDCPHDEGVAQLLATAQENKWCRCPECKRVIELTHGCYHITCRCKFEFCYLCLQQWKSCRCRTWDETRLLERGRQLAQNFMAPAPAPAPAAAPLPHQQRVDLQAHQPVVDALQAPQNHAQAMERAVQRVVEHVRNNHECRHDAFQTHRALGGRLDCEVCGQSFQNWIKQCKQCLTLMCFKCMHNRL